MFVRCLLRFEKVFFGGREIFYEDESEGKFDRICMFEVVCQGLMCVLRYVYSSNDY